METKKSHRRKRAIALNQPVIGSVKNLLERESTMKIQLEALAEHLRVTVESDLKMAKTCQQEEYKIKFTAEALGIEFALKKIRKILDANGA